jgi:hypothetical protein
LFYLQTFLLHLKSSFGIIINDRQHHQGEQGGRQQAADHHRGQGLLHFRPRRARQRHGQEAQRRHRGGHDDGPQAGGGAFADDLLHILQATCFQLVEIADQNDAIEHGHPE